MAIIQSRAPAINLNQMLTRIRRTLGDTETAAANQRFSDDMILDAMNLEMMKLWSELYATDAGSALGSANLVYTANAESMALPTGPATQPIFRVDDISNAVERPITLRRVDALEIENVGGSFALITEPAVYYAIIGDTLVIRPRPGGDRTVKIWYVQAPYVLGGLQVSGSGTVSTNVATVTVSSGHGFVAGMRISTSGFGTNATDVALTSVTATTLVYPLTAADGSISSGTVSTSGLSQHAIAVGNEELISLGATIRLQEIDQEVPAGRPERYAELWLRFLATASRYRGPKFVRANRRYH